MDQALLRYADVRVMNDYLLFILVLQPSPLISPPVELRTVLFLQSVEIGGWNCKMPFTLLLTFLPITQADGRRGKDIS